MDLVFWSGVGYYCYAELILNIHADSMAVALLPASCRESLVAPSSSHSAIGSPSAVQSRNTPGSVQEPSDINCRQIANPQIKHVSNKEHQHQIVSGYYYGEHSSPLHYQEAGCTYRATNLPVAQFIMWVVQTCDVL